MQGRGLNAWGRNVSEDQQREASIETLQRMIIYVRGEALRLRVMDVVLLLEHAENAVTAFAPTALSGHGVPMPVTDDSRVEH